MSDVDRIELRVEPLGRALLDGVVDPDDETGRRMRVDVGIVPCFEDERPLQGLAGYIDWRSCGMLSRLLRTGWCTGRAGESLLMPTRVGLPVERLVLIGLGPSRDISPTTAAETIGALVEVAHRLRPRSVLFAMPGLLQEREVVEAVFTGLARALAHGPLPKEAQDDEVASAAAEVVLADTSSAADPDAVEPEHEPHTPGEATSDPAPEPHRWWVVVDERHVARLQRLLGGPPRPAGI